jgi:hypothetical protein
MNNDTAQICFATAAAGYGIAAALSLRSRWRYEHAIKDLEQAQAECETLLGEIRIIRDGFRGFIERIQSLADMRHDG